MFIILDGKIEPGRETYGRLATRIAEPLKKSVAVHGSVLISYSPDAPNRTRCPERSSGWVAALRLCYPSGFGIALLREKRAPIKPQAYEGFVSNYSRKQFLSSMTFQKHDIVDYFDNRKISCGLILDVEDRRLRILSDQGKELKIPAARALIAARDPHFPLSGSRDEQVSRLKEISHVRDQLKSRVDLRELWEVVGLETREIGIEDLSELVFGKHNDSNSAASLLRAIFEDRLYFKIRPNTIEVPSPEHVEQALSQRHKEQDRQAFVAACGAFLAQLKDLEAVDPASAPDGLIPMLEEAALAEQDWGMFKAVKEIFSEAGLAGNWSPFTVLVKLGVWSRDENIRLRAEDIPVEFTSEAEVEARKCASKPLPPDAEDLTDHAAITIDASTTRDVDDALSLSFEGEDAIVGIHITDVAHFIEHDSFLDREIRQRAVSIYLPDITIPMIPPLISERVASLAVGQVHPSVSVMVRFGPDLEPKEHRIARSRIRISERLSYEEADARIADQNSKEAALFAIANRLRRDRMASGAIIFKDPELSVRVDEQGVIEINLRDREGPSQVLVSEMMILANGLFARFMKEARIPGIFRSQPPPTERIELGDQYDPVLSYRCRRGLSKGDIGTVPAQHATLGLDSYTTATSPLRRYSDLIVQRQIKAALKADGPLLTTSELEKILGEISYRLDRAILLERERQRYFLLRHLEQHRNELFEAVVLYRFPRFYLVRIASLGLNAALNAPISVSLNPYDRVIIRIEKINPREDKLNLSLVKLL